MSRLCPALPAAVLLLALPLFPGAAAAQPDSGVPVEVEPTDERAIRQVVRLTGTVTSAREASLSAATSGLVTQIHVDAGSRVDAGDTLLELDPELADWQWQSTQASVAAARAALEDAQRRLQEARTLAPQRSIAETVVRDLAAEVEEDEAALQQAMADAGFRRAVLDRHRLRAPFAGVVSGKFTELGEWVVPGTPVLGLIATGDLRIDFPVAEDYLGDVDEATHVTYRIGNDNPAPRAGRVETVVPVSDPGARTFLLRVRAREPDPRMIPGMSVRGEMHLDTGRRGLVVPRDAIIKYPDGRIIVWVVQGGNGASTVQERLVQTGLAFDGMVEIRAGLDAGARVVVKGNEALQVGQRVRVVEQPAG